MASTPAPSSSVTSGPVALPPVGELVGGRRRRWRKPENPISLAIRLVLLLVASVIFIYPFVWSVSASLKPRENVFDNKLIPTHWQFWNYLDVFRGVKDQAYTAPFAHWFFNSMYIGILAAVTVTISSALVAFAFAYFRFPMRNLLFGILLATMMLPGEVTMIPVYLLWNEIGRFTLDHPVLPHIGTGTQYPLWVPNMFGSAFYIFLQRQFFLGIPRDYFEAARIDGDGYFSMFRRIALPLAKPALVVVIIFELQAKWFDLLTPLIYLRDSALYTLPLGLKTILDQQGVGGGGEGRWEIIMAGTVITVLPMVILFAIFQRFFIEGIATQGRKG
jgi:multiple sugar transport system permease protein